MGKYLPLCALLGLCLALGACGDDSGPESPTYDHIVIVVEENHSDYQITADYPFFESLKAGGAYLSAMYAVTHPSQPNYLALFSGSTQGVKDDKHYDLDAANLYDSLKAADIGFLAFSENLPSQGWEGDVSNYYVRKHAPWALFASFDDQYHLPFSSFPEDFSELAAVNFVIPCQLNNMHDGSIATADQWLSDNISAYAVWAKAHNSLLIVTFDEPRASDDPLTVPIATYFYGAEVEAGYVDSQSYSLYSILRYIEDQHGLEYIGADAEAASISGIWGK